MAGYVLYMDDFPDTRGGSHDSKGSAAMPGVRRDVGAGDWGIDRHQVSSVSSARRMPDAKFSYRHDTGAWLNAAVGLAARSGMTFARASGRDARDDAFHGAGGFAW